MGRTAREVRILLGVATKDRAPLLNLFVRSLSCEGCDAEFSELLQKTEFKEAVDTLILVGDLVNKVLRGVDAAVFPVPFLLFHLP